MRSFRSLDRNFGPDSAMRRPARLGWAALVILFLGLAAAPRSGAEEFQPGRVRFESLLPDDCYALLSFGGIHQSVKCAEQLGLHQLWLEPEMQAFTKDLVATIRGSLKQTGFDLAPILKAIQGRLSIAIGDQTLVAGMIPVPAALIAVDTGNRTAEFQKLLATALQHAQQVEPSITRTTFRFGSHEVTSLNIPEAKASICYTFVDSLFVAGLNKYYLQRLLSNVDEASTRSLANDAAFRRTVAKLGTPDPTMFFYVNFRGFTNKLGPWMPPEALEYLEMFGVKNVDAIALAWVPSGTAAREVLYIDAPGEKKGLLKVLSPRPSGMKGLDLAPPETALFASLSLDLPSAYRELTQLFKTLAADEYRQFEMQVDGFEGMVGLSLEKDILAALGSEVTLYASLPAGGGIIPEVVGVLQLRDRAAFDRTLKVMLGMMPGVEFKKLDFEGSEIRYFSAPPGGPPITPSYTISGDLLVLGTSPNSLKQVIRARAEKRPSLADSAEFKAIRAKLAPELTNLEYLDLKRIVSAVYATATPFLQGFQGQIDSMGIPLNMALLPTVETVSKHLSAAASAWSTDRDGLLLECVSPIGLSAATMLALAAADSMDSLPVPMGGRSVVRASAPREVVAHATEPAQVNGNTSPAKPTRQTADSLFRKQDWAKAASAYEEIVMQNVKDGRAWFNLGFSLHSLGKYDQSIPAFERAAELGEQKPAAIYNVACGYSLKNDKDKAFDWLKKAMDAGFTDENKINSDSDLDNLRNDPRYKALFKKVY